MSTLRSTTALAVAIVLAAAATTLIATHRILGAAGQDLVLMGLTLVATGMLGIGAASVLPRWLTGFGLRGQVALVAALCLLALVANMAVAAALMFISGHDLRLLFVLLGFALVATVGPVQIVSRHASARLEAVESAASRLAAGELHARVAMTGSDEVARLAAEFNRMADALQAANQRRDQLEAARRELFASISHDLRTPLSSLQVMVEALRDGVVSDRETSERYLATMNAEIDHLSLLIDDLFELAKLDSGELQLRLESLHLEDLLEEAVALFQPQLANSSVALRILHGDPTPMVRADRARLQRVIQNLLSNALRHTPDDGVIDVETALRSGSVQVAVRDTGEGISPEDAPRVFDRFFRGDRSRSRGHGGSGLGLAIARAIVEAHGGEIWVEQRQMRGAAVVFNVPVLATTGASNPPSAPH